MKELSKKLFVYSGKGGTRQLPQPYPSIYTYTLCLPIILFARVLETGKRKDNDTESPPSLYAILQSNSTNRVLLKKGQEKRAQNLLFTLFNHDDEVLQHSLGW